MKLITLKQFEKKTKASLVRYIVKHLKKKTKKQLANFAYNITKSKLPKLKTVKQKKLIIPYEIKAQKKKLQSAIKRKHEAGFVIANESRKLKKLLLKKKDKNTEKKERSAKQKRKFSRKQLAAQRLFAKRAKAGTLRRRR